MKNRKRLWSLRVQMRWHLFALAALLITFVPGLHQGVLRAQSDLTTITGVVQDSSGAVVPNATVTLRDPATGIERKTTSGANGSYVFTNSPAGTYTLIVEAPGFKRFEKEGNVVAANVASTVDATLTVGSASDTVTVTAEAAPIQADSSTLGRDVTQRQIRDLQLNGRNPFYLAFLKPGVNAGRALGTFGFSLDNGININGGRNQDALITIDGAVAVRTRSNGTSIGVADADATQEVQILTANYNAEYGRASGGQIRIVTKSGTRDFHGVAYEYFRNSAIDANSWLRNRQIDPNQNEKAAPFRFNQFGYNVGGPIFIPGHFNRDRNRLFFLFSQEFVRYRQDQQNISTVPSLAMRTGDFSELLGPNGFFSTPKVITDPTTGQPFANNVIPSSRLSPNGIALLNVYPVPNQAPGQNDLVVSLSAPQNQRKDTGAVDYYLSDNQYLRLRLLNFNYFQYIPFASGPPVIPQTFNRPNQTISLNYIWTINPTLVNEFLVSASRDQVYINIDPSNGLYDRTKYGIDYPYLFPGTKNIANKIPSIALGAPFTELSGLPYPSSSKGPIYDISDNITKTVGAHTIKAGFLFERSGENDFDQINVQGVPGGTNNQNGRFAFADTTPGGSGLALGNAALGIFDVYAELGNRAYTPYRGFMYEFFGQDSWKITPKLHIDYGVRESIIVPYYSIWRNLSVFDPRFYDPASAVQVDPATGNPVPGSGDQYDGLVIPGSGFPDSAKGRVPVADSGEFNRLFHGLPKSYSDLHPWQGLQPRFGVAYSFNDKTVLRGGVGRFLTRVGVSDSVFLGGNPPFQPSASVSAGSVDNPGGGSAASFPFFATTQDPIFKNPEAWTWNGAVQRDVGFNTTVEIAYVGRRGLHGQQELDLNAVPAGTVYNNPGVAVDALRPYAGFDVIRSTNNVSTSLYNGLQVDVERRFSRGLLFGIAYTYSKSTDYGSSQRDVLPDYEPRNLVYGPSDFDHRHVAVINVIYDLPFYRDHPSSFLAKTVGGWRVSEVTQFQTGSPVSFQTNDDIAGVGGSAIGNSGNSNNGFQTRWLVSGDIAQPAQFSNVTTPGGGTFDGNQWYAVTVGQNILRPDNGAFSTQLTRNIFYQPGFQNWNFGLFKDFHFTETNYLTFRFEVFNWLNHPNWGGTAGGGLDANPKDANFGKITNKDSQRQLQLSLRYQF